VLERLSPFAQAVRLAGYLAGHVVIRWEPNRRSSFLLLGCAALIGVGWFVA
jgi:hypothetical protein